MRSVALSSMTGSSDDLEFAYAAKRDAFAQYVIPKWGWDEHFQRNVVAERLRVKRYFRILVDGVAVGTISIDEEPEHVQVGEFYIVRSFQNHGIGSDVLEPILA